MPTGAQARSAQVGGQGPTIEHAVDHLVEAATGVVKNQLELARLDVQVTLRRTLRSGLLLAVGALLLGGTCVALALMAYALFPDHVPPERRLAILAAVGAVAGGTLTAIGVRGLKPNGGGANGRH
jgi:hypothetical protein